MLVQLTARAALELVDKEAIVLEWYLDSAKPPVGTWGVGVTDLSGHKVARYKDNPQTIERVLEIYVWLLRTKYAPDVVKAFKGHTLTEAEFAAALSFHYNTGAIGRTDWVKLFLSGNRAASRDHLEEHYTNDTTNNGKNDGMLTPRRRAEAALFFDGLWAQRKVATIYPVRKPSSRRTSPSRRSWTSALTWPRLSLRKRHRSISLAG
jgi:lysozyme